MSKEDLKPITSTERAKEIGSKGGKSSSLAKKMINRKFCTSSCPLWNTCWAKHTAHTLYDEAVAKAYRDGWDKKEIRKLKPECVLKKLPSQVIQRSKRFIVDGEEGFNAEMTEIINRYADKIMLNPTAKDFEKYMRELRETKKAIYGDRSRIDATSKGEQISGFDFISEWKKVREEEKQEGEEDGEKE